MQSTVKARPRPLLLIHSSISRHAQPTISPEGSQTLSKVVPPCRSHFAYLLICLQTSSAFAADCQTVAACSRPAMAQLHWALCHPEGPAVDPQHLSCSYLHWRELATLQSLLCPRVGWGVCSPQALLCWRVRWLVTHCLALLTGALLAASRRPHPLPALPHHFVRTLKALWCSWGALESSQEACLQLQAQGAALKHCSVLTSLGLHWMLNFAAACFGQEHRREPHRRPAAQKWHLPPRLEQRRRDAVRVRCLWLHRLSSLWP